MPSWKDQKGLPVFTSTATRSPFSLVTYSRSPTRIGELVEVWHYLRGADEAEVDAAQITEHRDVEGNIEDQWAHRHQGIEFGPSHVQGEVGAWDIGDDHVDGSQVVGQSAHRVGA